MKQLYLFLICLACYACQTDQHIHNIYNTQWAICETDSTSKDADVFFICPSVYGGSQEAPRMSLHDEQAKAAFIGATNMERGIYDNRCRVFAPFYSQASLWAYKQDKNILDSILGEAYLEVRDAFRDYMENYNNGRPFILAGFSQGADHCIRILKEFGNQKDIADKLVACYAIGWRLTKDEVAQYPWLKNATSETDLGSIIAFSSEAPEINKSIIIADNEWSYSINPLSWTTSSDTIAKTYNKGACFTDYKAKIKKEIPELTGAYIDSKRGALKVTDVTADDYPPVIDICKPGEFHIYDYQFFYRNLEENVKKRIDAFLEKR
ncbi:MAG: DUF3089 domain-containing protein [Bacteroidaceae bacterium]|nr:DUF3089 domain-containing protein [Bacteroidaceae bacterium]